VPPTRTRVVRFSGILLLVLTLVATLTFLFQYQNHLKQFVKVEQADLITVAYLRLLVQMQPQEPELRLELAQKLRDLGRWDEAQAALQPILDQGDAENWPARLLSIEIANKKLYALAETDPRRQSVFGELGDQIARFSEEEIPDAYLEDIARLSLALARPEIAAELYDRLAVTDSARRPEWLATAARWHLASNSPKRAGQAYNKASTLSTDRDAAQRYAMQALEAYRAANEDAVTLSLAGTYVLRFPDNRQLLDRAIEIARAQQQQEQALEWGFQRLALDPTDADLLESQLNLALEAGNLPSALNLTRQLVQQNPEDSAARQRLAQIAEWAANPREALTQWRWLAHRAPESLAPAHALDLARGLGDNTARIELLILISRQRQLEDTEVKEAANSFRHTGGLHAGSQFLDSYVKQYPKHFSAWAALAQLQEEGGKLLAAAKTWRRIGSRFGQPVDAACNRAELLWRLEWRDEAFQLLLDVQADATDENVDYWKLLGTQGWELDRAPAALTAYRTLWRTDNADALDAERLILLARDANQPREAVAVAEVAFERFDEARFLLLGMDVAIAAELWNEVARLMHTARLEQQRFRDSEMYCLQEAMLAVHEGRHEAAQASYQRAMQLNPSSVPARVGLLWLLIDINDTRQLPAYLQRWESEALNEPAFWGAYAIALTKLGFTKKALPWYQRQAKANPEDYALLLSYSQTLAQAGKNDASWRLRRHVLRQLRSMTQSGTLTKANSR